MAPTTSRPWPPPSTADRARRSVGERLPRLSTPCCDPVRLPRLSTPCCDPVRLVLRRPIESGQYAAEPYRQVLGRHGIKQSMSRKGDCLDNAPMESFFGSLKNELVHRTSFPSREAARRAICEYVEAFYNRRRRHAAVGFLTPAQAYEQMARAA